MEDDYIKKIISVIILLTLIVLAFLLLKPILISIILGIILAFVFYPIYKWMNKYLISGNVTSFILCIILLILIIIPLWFLTPILIDQSFKIYQTAQQTDFVTPLTNIFPNILASEEFSVEVGSIIHSFVTRTANSFVNGLSDLILDFPIIFLQLMVVFFTFFFVLRDRIEMVEYVRSLIPFSKDVQNKLFESSRAITTSVLYGQVIIGILQGIVLGIGLFLFAVPNALFITLLAILAGVLPIIGTMIVWLPVMIILFIAGNSFAAIGVLIFGTLSSSMDNVLRPIIVSRMTKMNSSIVLIGMIGGLFMFGILGLILGPLILAYLLILLEFYRNKKIPAILFKSK